MLSPAERYEDDPAVVYLLDRDFRLMWCNRAWDGSALANGAPEWIRTRCFGRNLMDAICADLQDYYRNAFQLVLRYKREVGHLYECSTAERTRLYQMRILPEDLDRLIVVHSLVRESEAPVGSVGEYRGEDGFVRMCAHCRRTQRPGSVEWDWVPSFVAQMPAGTLQELCGFCKRYHYPERNSTAEVGH